METQQPLVNCQVNADYSPEPGPDQFPRAQSFAGDGLVVVDKPLGLTSHDVDFRLRRLAGTRKVGHAGTLDPNASGVLVLGLGQGTKLLQWAQASEKTYRGRVVFGVATNTEDAAGVVIEAPGAAKLWSVLRAEALSTQPELAAQLPAVLTAVAGDKSVIQLPLSAISDWLERLFVQFQGKIEQVPSSFSALKVQGKRAYDLARGGQVVALDPRPINIYRLRATSPVTFRWVKPVELLVPSQPRRRERSETVKTGFEVTGEQIGTEGLNGERINNVPDERVLVAEIEIEVSCSAGTYIRALARDLGRALGCPAHLGSLRRLAAGKFDLLQAHSLADLAKQFNVHGQISVISLAQACRLIFPSVLVDADTAYRISVGQKPMVVGVKNWDSSDLGETDQEDQLFAVFCDSELIALARKGKKHWSPQLVFQPSWRGKSMDGQSGNV